jgi:hypothetical protein
MRLLAPRSALALAGVLSAALFGCQQFDQQLPFDLDEGSGRTASIGASGGLLSIPPSFAIVFPTGSLSAPTTVTAAVRDSVFPATAGLVVPGLAFDVGPRGQQLLTPARVQVAVPEELLGSGDQIRLALALLRPGGQIVTQVTSYDVANGILFAEVSELGPMAAVVSFDAIPVLDLADLPTLGGGSIAPPALAPLPGGPLAVDGPAIFSAECSADARNCFTSGIVELWVDDVVRQRLGDDIVLMNTSVSGSVEFLAFDQSGEATQVVGFLEIGGELRARFNRVVSGRGIDDDLIFRTGVGTTPTPTTVFFSGNEMIFGATSDGFSQDMTFGVTGIGTGEVLTVRLEGDIEFANAGSRAPDVGEIVAHVRLRR